MGVTSIPYSPVVVSRCSFNNGTDKKGLIAVHFFLTPHNAEAQATRRVPPQNDVFAVVQMSAWEKGESINKCLTLNTCFFLFFKFFWYLDFSLSGPENKVNKMLTYQTFNFTSNSLPPD